MKGESRNRLTCIAFAMAVALKDIHHKYYPYSFLLSVMINRSVDIVLPELGILNSARTSAEYLCGLVFE